MWLLVFEWGLVSCCVCNCCVFALIVLCVCVFRSQGFVLLKCFVVFRAVAQVIVMRITFVFLVFGYDGCIDCEFVRGLGSYCFLSVFDFCKCRRRVCRSQFKLLVSEVSIFVFGVVGVVLVVVFLFLSSVSVVHSYLWVTGMIFLRQI